jgi:hypothetical protein
MPEEGLKNSSFSLRIAPLRPESLVRSELPERMMFYEVSFQERTAERSALKSRPSPLRSRLPDCRISLVVGLPYDDISKNLR